MHEALNNAILTTWFRLFARSCLRVRRIFAQFIIVSCLETSQPHQQPSFYGFDCLTPKIFNVSISWEIMSKNLKEWWWTWMANKTFTRWRREHFVVIRKTLKWSKRYAAASSKMKSALVRERNLRIFSRNFIPFELLKCSNKNDKNINIIKGISDETFWKIYNRDMKEMNFSLPLSFVAIYNVTDLVKSIDITFPLPLKLSLFSNHSIAATRNNVSQEDSNEHFAALNCRLLAGRNVKHSINRA